MLPLAVPGLVLAVGYLSMTQEGRFFAWLNPSADPTLLLMIAYAMRRLPYIVRSAVAGLQQTSVALEEAALNLGATPRRVLSRITLPLVSANLVAGGLLAFSFAMLEVSDSLVLAQKQQHYPITKAIYELFQLIGDGRFLASALGVWAMVFLGVTLLLANRTLGRRLGVLFRV
jgi:iron(III) transport system permease protein